jgi:hypothetical protein
LPNKAELLKIREARAYWQQYARLFPNHRIEVMDGRRLCTLVPLDRRGGNQPVTLTSDTVEAFQAYYNEGRAYAAAQKD